LIGRDDAVCLQAQETRRQPRSEAKRTRAHDRNGVPERRTRPSSRRGSRVPGARPRQGQTGSLAALGAFSASLTLTRSALPGAHFVRATADGCLRRGLGLRVPRRGRSQTAGRGTVPIRPYILEHSLRTELRDSYPGLCSRGCPAGRAGDVERGRARANPLAGRHHDRPGARRGRPSSTEVGPPTHRCAAVGPRPWVGDRRRQGRQDRFR
jgi:hypothetical protein